MRLWVDDLRKPPHGWHWAQTSSAAIACLASYRYTDMSLDHDLGGDDTTRAVVLWLCEQDDSLWPDSIAIHSMNNVGREWLVGMVHRYHPATTPIYGGK